MKSSAWPDRAGWTLPVRSFRNYKHPAKREGNRDKRIFGIAEHGFSIRKFQSRV
jgi:hypothetical protein